MWIITGVLLGLACLVTLIGFHSGPHAHFVGAAIGFAAAGCLAYMLVRSPGPVLWALLGADVAAGAGIVALAWRGLVADGSPTHHRNSLENAEGIAVSQLAPDGIVRVRGELWSAISLNGVVPVSTPVQVVRAVGVRLEVWGDDAEPRSTEGLFELGADVATGRPQ
jgi:membrane-bound ClpP family serine protease